MAAAAAAATCCFDRPDDAWASPSWYRERIEGGSVRSPTPAFIALVAPLTCSGDGKLVVGAAKATCGCIDAGSGAVRVR